MGVGGCGHTTHAPLPSAPWEAWLEEILRSAQRDHPVPAEGKLLPQCPYLGRASSFSLPAPALWYPEGLGQDLGLRQIWVLPHQGPDLGLPRALVVSGRVFFKCPGAQRIPSVRPVQASGTN